MVNYSDVPRKFYKTIFITIYNLQIKTVISAKPQQSNPWEYLASKIKE